MSGMPMKKRLLPLLAIAFVVAIVSTALFYSLLAGRLNAASAQSARSRLVIAARDVKPGTVLAAADLTTIPWSGGPLALGTFGDVASVTGKTAIESIPQGEPVVASRLASKDGASVGIPEGMRAVSVHISDSSGVVGLLKPGYKVDVQAFGSRISKPGQAELRTILRGVTVLAVNPQPEQSSQGYNAPVVTLLIPAAEAEGLAAADSYARLRLTLRNPLEPVGDSRSSSPVAPGHRPTVAKADEGGASTSLNVTTVSLSDDGVKEVGRQLGLGLENVSLQVSIPRVLDLASLVRQGFATLNKGEILGAPRGRFAYYQLPRPNGKPTQRARVGIESLGRPDHYRVRPEIWVSNEGRLEARSLETEVVVPPGSATIVSGVGGRMIVIISNARSSS